MYASGKLSNKEKLKYKLKRAVEDEYSGLDISINNLSLGIRGLYPGRTVFNSEIDTHLSERADVINLTNIPIKQPAVKQLREDQKRYDYEELTIMVAGVSERHYEKD